MHNSRWLDAVIAIQCQHGPREVPALTHPQCPGLAVTMSHFGLFGVTHVASGRSMGGSYERCGSAARELVQWQQIATRYGFSWELPGDALQGVFREHAQKPVPFEGGTVTSMGETRPLTIGEWRGFIVSPLGTDEFPWESPDQGPWRQVDLGLAGLAALADIAAQDAPDQPDGCPTCGRTDRCRCAKPTSAVARTHFARNG